MANGGGPPIPPSAALRQMRAGVFVIEGIDPHRIHVIHTPHGGHVQSVADTLGAGSVVINGTFFAGSNTLGIIISGGQVLEPMDPNIQKGDRLIDFGERFVFSVDTSGHAAVMPGKALNPATCQEALGGLTGIVTQGQKLANFFGPGGWDKNAIGGSRPRTAVGVRANGKIVLLAATEKLTLTALADEMIGLSVRDAAALDGGRSTSLAVGGRAKPIIKGGNQQNGNDGVITTFLGVR